MKKISLFLILFFLSLNARENPFFPVDGMQELSYTSNNIDKVDSLNRVAISFPNTARRIKKITIEYQNLDGAIEKKTIELNHEIDWHIPVFISQTYANSSKDKSHTPLGKKLFSYSVKFTTFTFFDKKIHIKTKDTMIRDFMLTDPQRIVIDFKRESNFLTMSKEINKSIFKSVVIGNHSGYYRCVFTLDGKYRYSLQENKESLKISIY